MPVPLLSYSPARLTRGRPTAEAKAASQSDFAKRGIRKLWKFLRKWRCRNQPRRESRSQDRRRLLSESRVNPRPMRGTND
jgi:hypothetical protein